MRLKIDETLKHLINRRIAAVDARAKAISCGNTAEAHYWAGYFTAVEGVLISVYGLAPGAIESVREYQEARKQRTIFE